MIKQIAWNTFKQTGNIDTFMELMQVEDLEKDILGTRKNICELDREIKWEQQNKVEL